MPDRTTTVSGLLVLPARAGDGDAVRVAPGVVSIEGDQIAGVRETAEIEEGADFGGSGYLVSPGFIDAHVHLPQFDSIGVSGLELLDWLERVIFPAEARWADADYAGQMAARVTKQLFSFGTTAVGAYATVHHAAARAAIEALGEAGMSGCVGQVLMDRGAPAELVRPAGQLVKEAASLRGHGAIVPAVTPRFAISCTDELLRAAGELATKTGWLVQTHLAETKAELREVGRLFGGLPYVEVYRRAGLLSSRSILGHGIHLDDGDRRVLSQARSVIAHCPTANRFLRAGAMDLAGHRAAGVQVAVGSDVAGGPDRSMVRVGRAAIETAQSPGAAGPSAGEVWGMMTQGNARCLGLEGMTGRLMVGHRADVVLVRPGPETAAWMGAPDPLAAVMYGWDDRWLERVWASGRAVHVRGAGHRAS